MSRPTVELLPEPEQMRIPTTGAVASAQEAVLTMPDALAALLWTPDGLERLARSYWRHLRRASLGLVRVIYGDERRTVVLLARPLALLRFRAPEYALEAAAAAVTWRIERGLLVAAEGRGSGRLRIEIERRDPPGREGGDLRPSDLESSHRMLIRVEVSNFYPWLRGSGRFARVGAWLYSQTQVRIHRRITVGFLRSLERIDAPTAPGVSIAGRARTQARTETR